MVKQGCEHNPVRVVLLKYMTTTPGSASIAGTPYNFHPPGVTRRVKSDQFNAFVFELFVFLLVEDIVEGAFFGGGPFLFIEALQYAEG